MLTNLCLSPLKKSELIRNPVLAPPTATFLATESTGMNCGTLTLPRRRAINIKGSKAYINPRPFTGFLEFVVHKASVGPHITNKVVILPGAASP